MQHDDLAKWLWRCELALVYASVLATVIMMLPHHRPMRSAATLFNRPIIGAYEITEKYLMVAAIFLGLSYAYRGGMFIRVTFLVDRLPGAAQLAADYFAHLVSLAFCLVVRCCDRRSRRCARSRDDTELSTLPILVGPAYLPRAARLPGADRDHAHRSAARAQRPSRSCSGKRRPPHEPPTCGT